MLDPISKVLGFLNSNLGFVTVAVGLIAWVIYWKQKRDNKRDAATLILQEIRYAEQQIRNARTFGSLYFFGDKLLPTNSWHKNINLFVNDLEPTGIDLISKFYSCAGYLDAVIGRISDYTNSQCFNSPQFQGKPYLLIPVLSASSFPVSNLSPLPQATISQQSGASIPQVVSVGLLEISPPGLRANEVLKEVSNKIELLYNTPAVAKLSAISRKRWYEIF